VDADSSPPGWLLLLAQLPSTPSSARVALWRRLRAIGATSVVNGTWVLPDTAPHRKLFEELQESVRKQNGTGFALIVHVSSPDTDEAITQRFRADRSQEYDEFAERCTALLDEIRKEAKAGKYTFAEMEESEQDLEKLVRWLAKIQARDFFPDERRQEAAAMLARCQITVAAFSQAVYAAEEVTGSGARELQAPDGADAGQLDPIQPV
jgi:predicted Mrr-cat superfamily restriction endonuclease